MRRCSKCVLPDTIPKIEFNREGVCNYCTNYKHVQYKGKAELERILNSHRDKNQKYDCMVGISGGRDSAFTLWKIVKEYGMRVLSVNYANPFTSEQAKANMKRMTEILNVDFVTFELKNDIHRKCFRNGFSAWLRKPSPIGMDIMCIPCRLSGPHLFRIAKEKGISLIVLGGHPTEVSSFKRVLRGLPRSGTWKNRWFANFLYFGIRELIRNPYYINYTILPIMIKAFLYLNKYSAYFKWRYHGIKPTRLFEYIKWDEQEILSTIQNELGWQKSSDKESPSRFDCQISYLKKYLFLTCLGFTDKDDLFSKMIREGLISREEALKRLHVENEINMDLLSKILNEVGFDLSDLERLRQFREASIRH